MKKLTLFEIGLKCDVDQYDGYVAAENASEAEKKARNKMITTFEKWWEEEGRNFERDELEKVTDGLESSPEGFERIEEIYRSNIKNLESVRLTKLIEVGEVII